MLPVAVVLPKLDTRTALGNDRDGIIVGWFADARWRG